jgi:orotate phosphoribosyltransferase
MTVLSDKQVEEIFVSTGAILSGHFNLTSGRHSDTYIQCARVLEHPRLTRQLAQQAVAKLPPEIRDSIDLVASPAVGGILFGFAIADVLDKPMVFCERVDGRMTLRRAFIIPAGARVLVAEDVVTSGGSVAEVCQLVEQNQAQVVAVSALIDRGGQPIFSPPFFPILRRETPSWLPEECGLCQQQKPIDSPGSRRLI